MQFDTGAHKYVFEKMGVIAVVLRKARTIGGRAACASGGIDLMVAASLACVR